MIPHSPLNQRCTTEYQSKLVGRKMNPSAGTSQVANIPWNQFVSSHSPRIVSRGTNTPNNNISNGILPLALNELCAKRARKHWGALLLPLGNDTHDRFAVGNHQRSVAHAQDFGMRIDPEKIVNRRREIVGSNRILRRE